jgi:ADP-ribosylglycohydrolase
VEQIRATYTFNESCAGTVPEALIAALEANDFESAIRNAISLGGDADTVGCIAGGVAQALFKDIPHSFIQEALNRLPSGLKPTATMFMERFPG